MSKPRTLFGLILAAFVIMGLALPLCQAAETDKSETRIKGLRVSVKGTSTRLIFDAEGAKPKQIGPESPDGISVFFSANRCKAKRQGDQRRQSRRQRGQIQKGERLF